MNKVLKFLRKVKRVGVEDEIPFLLVDDGIVIFGNRNNIRIEFDDFFRSNQKLFNDYGINEKIKGCFFDLFNSYFLENCSPKMLRTKQVDSHKNVLDIGTRGGHLAVKIAANKSFKGKVYCVDPTDNAHFYFNLHKRKNQLDNIYFLKYALGDRLIEKEFYFGGDNETYSGFLGSAFDKTEKLVFGEKQNPLTKKIQMNTVDNLLFNNEISDIGFMTIQVNGFELDVLKGAIEMLTQMKPKVYCTAFMNQYLGRDIKVEIIEFMNSLGYYLKVEDNEEVLFYPKL